MVGVIRLACVQDNDDIAQQVFTARYVGLNHEDVHST